MQGKWENAVIELQQDNMKIKSQTVSMSLDKKGVIAVMNQNDELVMGVNGGCLLLRTMDIQNDIFPIYLAIAQWSRCIF